MSQDLVRFTTPFVGREQELAQIDELLRDPDCRLLTILGPGGIGKTRLAIEVAIRVVDRYENGVVYADLQSLTGVHYLAQTIAEDAGIQLVGQNAEEQLLQYLRDRQQLLILDNFEHLLDGAELVSRILAAAPDVQCIATSRQVLSLQEEWLFRLGGLRTPAEETDMQDTEAVKLFVQRARRMRHDFDLQAELDDVVSICRLTDGMPLALELAASWVRTMGTEAIAREIEHGLDILSSGMRNLPSRHRSMHATLAQSWQRLSEQERQVFAQLSVFRGGFRRQQAQSVTGASLALLAELVDRSLLRWEPDGRYTMHELVRQFGAEKLQEALDVEVRTHQRHAEAYADFLHSRSESLYGARQYEVLDEIRGELDNIRVAIQWAMEHAQLDSLDRLLHQYFEYCDWRGHFQENTDVLELAVGTLAQMEQTTDLNRSSASYYAYLAWCYIRLGDPEKSIRCARRSDAIRDDAGIDPMPGFGTEPLAAVGLAFHILGDYDQALSNAQEARRRDISLGDDLNLMIAEYVLCGVYIAMDRLDDAHRHGRSAASLAERWGNSWFLAYVLMELGKISMAQGNLAAAQSTYQESYSLKEGAVDPEGMAAALNQLGRVALLQGNHREAERLHSRSLTLYEEIGDPGGRAITLHGLGNAALTREDFAQAAATYILAMSAAETAHYWPQALAIMVDVADLMARLGRAQDCVDITSTVIAHRASDATTTRHARELLASLTDPTRGKVRIADDEASGPDLEVAVASVVDLLREVEADIDVPRLDPASSANAQLAEPLTEREMEVLQLMAGGMTNPQIAAELIISVGTVKSYTGQIYGKLAVRNRTQAVNRARELGLLMAE